MQVAIFGAGRIGHIHAGNVAVQPGVALARLCDPNESNARELAEIYGARVSSQEEIFTDPAIKAVIIAASTDSHSPLIKQAAAAGKHIFCEKPVDLSLAQAQACAMDVKKAGVACMIGFQRRFDPTFHEAHRRLQRGEIGAPEMLTITSRDPGAPPLNYIASSGGIFRDMLIHDFDIARWILCDDGDEIVWLTASGSCLTDPQIAAAGDIDTTAVTLRSRKGRLAQINTSRRAVYGYDQRFEILGSKGLLQCGNVRSHQVTQANAQAVCSALPEPFFLERYRDAYRLEITHFFDCLRQGTPPCVTIEDGVAAQALADAAARSFASKTGVDL